MGFYKDDQGQLWEYDSDLQAEKDNLIPATPADIELHNKSVDHAAAVAGASEGTGLQAIGQAAERGVGMMGQVLSPAIEATKSAITSATGFGATPAGLTDTEEGVTPGDNRIFPHAYGEDARLVREAHPTLAGIGTGLAAAPAAALGVALAPAGPALLTGTVGGILANSGVNAAYQEYDDAWLEERPMELSNVAALTGMFALGDVVFRGAGKLVTKAAPGRIGSAVGSLLGYAPEKGAAGAAGVAERNIVAEAQGQLDKGGLSSGRRVAQSVGAASAAEMDEPFDAAIRTMSPRDAAVLARDAEDTLPLISMHSADAVTRLNNGLSESLGNNLRYADMKIGADAWTPKVLEAQSKWLTDIADQGEAVTTSIREFTRGNPDALDFGNLGKQAAADIESFTHRIMKEPDGGERNILLNAFKQRMDKNMMKIDASFNTDATTREELKSILRPLFGKEGEIRKGLENPKLFGSNAVLQKSLNRPWAGLLEHWSAFQNKLLEATGHIKYDDASAGRITKESTAKRLMAVYGEDPRMVRELGAHIDGALDNMQGLIEARQAHGITGKDGLESMLEDIRNFKEEWNLASTVGVAKNRVAAMKRDPKQWASAIANLAERTPVVGQAFGAVRTLGKVMESTHLEKGTPLADVWDQAYKRFARHEAWGDPSYSANYADWIQDALRERGAPIAPRGPGGGLGGAVKQAVSDHGNKVAGAGLFAAGAAQADGEGDDGGNAGALGAAAGGLALALGGKGLMGKVSLQSDPSIAAPWYKALRKAGTTAAKALPEAESDAVSKWVLKNATTTKLDPHLLKAVERLAIDNPTAHGPLYRGLRMSPAEIDKLAAAGEYTTSGVESASYRHGVARSFADKYRAGSPVMLRINTLDKGADVSHFGGLGEMEVLIPPEKRFKILGRGELEDGTPVLDLEQATSPAEGQASAADMPPEPPPPERPTPESQSPDVRYREAMKGIAAGGDALVRQRASDALRRNPPKTKDPLTLFTGKRSLDDAVDQARDTIAELGSDPEALIERLAGSTGALSQTHPSVYMALVGKANQLVSYLQQNVPPRVGKTLLDPEGMPPSADRSLDFAYRFVGSTMPAQAMRDIAGSNAPPEEVLAFQQNWGELWEPLRAEMLGQVQRMYEAGRGMDSERLRRLDSLLGMNGQLDPSASVEVGQQMLAAQDQQSSKAQSASQSVGTGAQSGTVASGFRTRLAALQAGANA
jgi:hypothetical protein